MPILNVTRRRATSFGIRSIGGLAGGFIGALICCRLRHVSFFASFRMLDVMAFAMPFAFMVGRLGCAIVHDHPGRPSASWIAVRFPGGPRYDLGVTEFLFLIPISALFYFLGRKPRPAGLFLGLYGVIYGSLRIWLDTLHIQPMRFYEGIALCCLGVTAFVLMSRYSRNLKPADSGTVPCGDGAAFARIVR
jgi:phosphatidylglycerol:prolipoprotein diacylglycerol transferase